MKKILVLLSGLLLGVTTISCDKFLDIEPQGKIIPKTVEDFRKVLTAAYQGYPKHKSLSNFRTDEVFLEANGENLNFLGVKDVYTFQDANPDKQTLEFGYDQFYKTIFYANQTINEGVNTMEAGDEREQLLGEAYAIRAMAYFDLTNLYAKPYNPATASTDLAIVLQNKIDIENRKPKSTMAEVYAQIHSDIEMAKKHLRVTFYEAGKNYRFTQGAIYALEARVNLYQHEYEDALASIDKAMTYKSDLQNLNTTKDLSVADFKSVESILALETALQSTLQSLTYVSEDLLNAFDKENDLRFAVSFEKSGDFYVPVKTGRDNQKVSFRTSDLYMMKAEALTHLNRLTEATGALKSIIDNRYKPEAAGKVVASLNGLDQKAMMKAILDESFKEFAFEGRRWFDLRRLDQKEIKHNLGSQVYRLTENDLRYTLPFPKKARENNPNL